jgi:hypothetical protein
MCHALSALIERGLGPSISGNGKVMPLLEPTGSNKVYQGISGISMPAVDAA